jgi:hypothetical protein
LGVSGLKVPDVLDDNGCMNRPTYEPIQWTQHYRKMHGVWYRDAYARNSADGRVWLVSFREDVAA